YTFMGWNTKDDGTGIDYGVLSIFSIKENITLYAKWQENAKYTITYFGNTNTSGNVPLDSGNPYYVNSNVIVLGLGDLRKENYSFKEWNTQADGEGTTYNAGSSFAITANTNLYAIWKENDKYTITYHGNTNTGGSAPSDSNSSYYVGNSVITLGQATLIKTNYTFMGWNTKADGTGTNYLAGATFNINANTDLYANWKENNKYTITYNGNTNTGGTIPSDSSSPYYDGSSVTTLGQGSLVKANYTFDSWNTRADGGGTSYKSGSSFNIRANTILYAIWNENAKYTITYHGNDNTSGAAPTDGNSPYYVNNIATILGPSTLRKTNYTFVGWNTKAEGDGTNYGVLGSVEITANINLYAKWQENAKYTITYHGNNNTDGNVPFDSSSPYYENTSITILPVGGLSRDNYTFVGWNTKADGQGTPYNAGSTLSIKENTNLYAIWEENAKYRVTYFGNTNTGGSVPTDSNQHYVGSSVTPLGVGTLVKANYTFDSWNTKADGSGNRYILGSSFIISSNTNLYAIWKENAK
ncbi:MAG: InlB B-repeat-containing protein, partial [Bacilli bacterium]